MQLWKNIILALFPEAEFFVNLYCPYHLLKLRAALKRNLLQILCATD